MLVEGKCLLVEIVKAILIFAILFIISSFKGNEKKIAEISNYLSNVSTISSNFIQINDDGTELSGSIKIKRPGKLLVDYNSPENKFLVSDGKKVALINRKRKDISIYNIDQLPVKLFLSKSFSLSDYEILKYIEKNNIIELEITVNNSEINNSLVLIFEDKPLKLRKWIIKGFNNSKTEMFLLDVIFNEEINNKIFEIIDPRKIPFGKKE